MADLFHNKAQNWDGMTIPQQLSQTIGPQIVKHVRLHEDMEVMDFGAGTGLLTAHIVPHVKRVTAVDISESMLERLAAKPEFEGKVRCRCQDIIHEPLEESFDLIVSAMAMHHVEDTRVLCQRFAQHLKPGGKIALADLDSEDGEFHPEATEGVFHLGFDREALQTLLEDAGFTAIEFLTAHTVTKEGSDYPIFLVLGHKAVS